MASRQPTARTRQSVRSQHHPTQEPIDVNTLFPSKAPLAPPSSASSFVSAWEQHTATGSSAPSSFSSSSTSPSSSSFSRGDGDTDAVDEVVLEVSDGSAGKSTELADAVLLLRPPRRSNDPVFQSIPLRTQSTASPPQPVTYSTLTSYASAPGKRQLDEHMISSSQPLPSERWDDDEPMVHSPAATKRKIQHLTPPKSHIPAAVASKNSFSPPVSHTIIIPPPHTATSPSVTTTTTAYRSTASSKAAAESAAEPAAPSVLQTLQLLSPRVYNLSQYHMLLGICMMRDGEVAAASEQFTLAEELFRPALDLVATEAFGEQRADLMARRAKATGEAALALQTSRKEKEDETEEKRRSGLEKAKELYAVAINAAEGKRSELWNDLCLFLLRIGELQTAGQLLELLASACGDCLDLFVNLGVLHTVYGDAEAAADYFQHVLARRPQHVTALVDYAASLSSREQHAAAIRILTLAHQLHPRSVVVLNNLAVEHGLVGDHMAAAARLQQADEIGYETERVATVSLSFNTANQMLALACEQRDDEVRNKLLDGADALLTGELAKERERPSQVAVLLYMCRGNVSTEKYLLAEKVGDREFAQKLFGAAESDYMAALKLQPDNSDAWVQMCGLYELHQEAGRAKDIYTRLLDTLSTTAVSLPASAVPLLNNLALLLMDNKEHEAAVEMLNMAKAVMEPLVADTDAAATVPSSPSSPSSPPSLSPSSASHSAFTSAAGTTGLSAATQLASVLVNLSHCQQVLGDLNAALESLQHARRLRPAHLSTLAGLSSVYTQLGAWKAAEAAMNEAAALEVDNNGKGAELELVKRNQRTLSRLRERSESEASQLS